MYSVVVQNPQFVLSLIPITNISLPLRKQNLAWRETTNIPTGSAPNSIF